MRLGADGFHADTDFPHYQYDRFVRRHLSAMLVQAAC
jgi:hypothetical protein